MTRSLGNLTSLCQELFTFKDLSKEDMMSVSLDVDYYKGEFWGVSPLFFKDLINYKIITEDSLKLINALKQFNVISAVVTEFSAGCDVLKHSDADLIQSPHIIRVLIPLELRYRYNFSGMYFEDGATTDEQRDFGNETIVFVPTIDHSFKNLNSFSQFFIIADISTDDSKLTKEFWDSYLYFSISNYIR